MQLMGTHGESYSLLGCDINLLATIWITQPIWDLCPESENWALRSGFGQRLKPLGYDLGLKVEVWAMRLGYPT